VPEEFYTPPGDPRRLHRIDGEGNARAWDKPGLGIMVDWDWVNKHTVRVEDSMAGIHETADPASGEVWPA